MYSTQEAVFHHPCCCDAVGWKTQTFGVRSTYMRMSVARIVRVALKQTRFNSMSLESKNM